MATVSETEAQPAAVRRGRMPLPGASDWNAIQAGQARFRCQTASERSGQVEGREMDAREMEPGKTLRADKQWL